MKNHVTCETAVRLKEAGFPQPAPEAGQFWYDLNGSMFVVYYEGGEGNCFLRLENGDSFACIDDGYIFAPTAIDILQNLGEGFKISFWNNPHSLYAEKWVLEDVEFANEYYDENPAEAAAQAFLNLKAEQ